jgi:hypothetical protein
LSLHTCHARYYDEEAGGSPDENSPRSPSSFAIIYVISSSTITLGFGFDCCFFLPLLLLEAEEEDFFAAIINSFGVFCNHSERGIRGLFTALFATDCNNNGGSKIAKPTPTDATTISQPVLVGIS